MGDEDLLLRVLREHLRHHQTRLRVDQDPGVRCSRQAVDGEQHRRRDDAGIITYSAAYEDIKAANVLVISGTDPYESKTVVFTKWMMRSKAKMIFVVPRRTMGVAYAESKGGLFLQIVPGTDALLHMSPFTA